MVLGLAWTKILSMTPCSDVASMELSFRVNAIQPRFTRTGGLVAGTP